MFVPPPFTWTGFYIGLNAGGIWPSGSRNADAFRPDAAIDGGFLNAAFPGGLGIAKRGFIGGGQAGYNWQTGAFVLGVETDFDGTTVSKSFNNVGTPFAARAFRRSSTGDILNVNGKASLSWLGTTRARVGFVATPDNRLMIYATGGVAYGGGSSHFSVFDSTTRRFLDAAAPAPPASAGQSAAVLNTRSPTTSRSRANISTPISAARSFNSIGNTAAATFFPEPSMRRQDQLQRVDLPRWRELQVLSAPRSDLNSVWPEERRLSSGTFLRAGGRPNRRIPLRQRQAEAAIASVSRSNPGNGSAHDSGSAGRLSRSKDWRLST